MRLTFEQFKRKIAETKAKIAQHFEGKLGPKTVHSFSMTQRRRRRRAYKTRARAACDSFRYRQKHMGSIRAKYRREQQERRRNRLTGASSSLRRS